jgi:hypothetical protein
MSDALADAISRLRVEMQSWNSIEMRAVTTQAFREKPPIPDPFVQIEERYVETSLGQRKLVMSATTAKGARSRYEDFCDGVRCAHVTFADAEAGKQEHIDIKSFFSVDNISGASNRPVPLRYFYVEKAPLHKALSKARHLGDGKALGRECDLFLFTEVKLGQTPLDMVYTLDRETSVPLRLEAYLAGAERMPGATVLVWKATTLDRVQGGHHFPLHSRAVSYSLMGHKESIEDKYDVEEIAYDRDYDAKTFWPAYDPGVVVNDAIKKSTIRVPGPKPPEVPKAEAVAPAVAAVPVRAEPPTSWSAIAGASALGLGVLLVLAAVVLKFRGR